MKCKAASFALMLAAIVFHPVGARQQTAVAVPSYQMTFGAFLAKFETDGNYSVEGQGWPRLAGNWKISGDQIELSTGSPADCQGLGRYRLRLEGTRLTFDLVSDECRPRKMILDHSTWSPAGEAKTKPP